MDKLLPGCCTIKVQLGRDYKPSLVVGNCFENLWVR